MKTCKLEITVDLKGNEKYIAYEDSVVTHPTGSNIVTRMDEIHSPDMNDIVTFLSDRGVELDEIKFAFSEMEKNGHNKAGFGTFGSFISSWFEGSIH